jgi:hypothetical protein
MRLSLIPNGGVYPSRKATTPVLDNQDIQERAQIALKENKRYPNRDNNRRYLLRGLVKGATRGSACTGQSAIRRDKKYHYYICYVGRTKNFGTGRPHKPPYVKASWLEELVWGPT